MTSAMDAVGVFATWAQTHQISNPDILMESGNCFSLTETQKRFGAGPAAKMFIFALKGLAVTGQEALQYYGYLDVPTGLPAAFAPACSQLHTAMLHFATLGTRGQCRTISAYSQWCGFLCVSSWRVLDLLAGSKFGAFTGGPSVVPEAYRLDCLEKLAVKEGLDPVQTRWQFQQVVNGLTSQTIQKHTLGFVPVPEKEPVATGMKALPNTAGRNWKAIGLVFASVFGQLRAATVEDDAEDQEAVYKQFATQAVFEMRGFFGTDGLGKIAHLMWLLLQAFVVLGLLSLLFALARTAAWMQQPQRGARTYGERETQTEEPEGPPPPPPPPDRAQSSTPSPTRWSLPSEYFMSKEGERLHAYRDCRHIGTMPPDRVRTVFVCATCRQRRQ